jgi:DNA-binding response OmpR family regulator
MKTNKMLAKLPSGSETILVVDDDDTVRALLRETLKLKGYTVLDARFNSGALLVVGRHEGPIHLLVADLMMPGINGRELARRLAALRPDMKLLYISGYPKDAVFGEKLLEEGAAFLEKPISPDILLPKVREILDAHDGYDGWDDEDFVINTLTTLLDQQKVFKLSSHQLTQLKLLISEYEKHRLGYEADFMVAELHVQTLIQDDVSTLADIETACRKSESAQTFLRMEGVKALRAAEGLLNPEQRGRMLAFYPHGRRRGPDRLNPKSGRKASR